MRAPPRYTNTFLAALSLLIASTASNANPQLVCKTALARDQIIIYPQSMTAFGYNLNCISGSFISDMTPCAPPGGFGLSMPTGSAQLSGAGVNPADYEDHMGGLVRHFVSDSNIYFSGGWHSSDGDYTIAWEFSIDRLTGIGELKQEKGPTRKYKCAKVEPKF